MSSSANDNSNSGNPTKPDKPKENSSQSTNLSDYIGLPKAQAVQSYVKSVYGWIGGLVPKTLSSNQASPESSSTANVTLASPGAAGGRKIAVHPSQNKESYNVISIDKAVTADGEPLSQNAGSSSESSNNTTETPFSDLSTTPSDQIGRQPASNTTVTAKEKEEDSWANLKDVKSENETMILSTKSNTSITKDDLASNEKPLSAPKSVEENKQPQDDIQFSFLNQLRALEDEKNKEFLVPDQVYFGDRDKSAQVHKPDSTKMDLKPPAKSASSAPSATVIPPIENVKNFLSNLLPAKKSSATDNTQKE